MQVDRLFGIIYILLNGRATAGELAKRLGVSKRTILRDADTLSTAGVPIIATQGKNGGLSLMDGYVLDRAALTADEREQILIGLGALAPTGGLDTRGALAKLGASETDCERFMRVDYSRWGNASSDREKFSLVRTAVTASRALSFTYYATDGVKSQRTVYPLRLLFKGRSWYLQAYCLGKNAYRTFKLNRMLDVKVCDGVFDKALYVPPDEPDACPEQKPTVSVRALFSPAVAHRLYDEFDPRDITETDDGNFSVAAELPLENWVDGYFLSFGVDLLSIEPESLRDGLLRKLDELKRNLGDKL